MWKNVKRFCQEDVIAWFFASRKKPIRRQLIDLVRLYKIYRYMPYQYFKHDLYLDIYNENIILNYIPSVLADRYNYLVNPEDSRGKVQNKVLFAKILAEAGLPVLDTLFLIFQQNENIIFESSDEEQLSFDEFFDYLHENHFEEIFLKPSQGMQGRGAKKLLVKSNGLFDGSHLMSSDKFFAMLSNMHTFPQYLVQDVIRQHPLLNRFNASSINTIRIVTLLNDDKIDICGAVLRMGNNNSAVDNWSAGGLVVGVNLDTGKLGKYAKGKSQYFRPKIMTQHPKTKFVFEDTTLPFWDEVIDIVCKGALQLQPLRLLGWDIAITATGPVIIEANEDSQFLLLQEGVGGLRYTAIGAELASYHQWGDPASINFSRRPNREL